jgi:pimeloyl-ACP methyl ester carboxylesterase
VGALAFEREVGFGLYTLTPFDSQQKTIVFVHGISDSPKAFRPLVERLPADYQVLLFHYPSGLPLEHTSKVLAAALEELLRRTEISQLDIVAHSMGGLVSSGMLDNIEPVQRALIRRYITIATPFAGHAAAKLGTQWAPTVAPVWWSMVPDSSYLQSIADLDLSNGPYHHLLFTYSHQTGGESKGSDGVVSVNSQLAYTAQHQATGVYGIADSHRGVLQSDCTAELLLAILASGSERVSFPEC